MSSTPGTGLTPNVTGLNRADAEFTWNASYGEFLDWRSSNYTVSRLSQPVINHGEKVYWSFTDVLNNPRSCHHLGHCTGSPVRTDPGSSNLTLGWEGNFTVRVQKNG